MGWPEDALRADLLDAVSRYQRVELILADASTEVGYLNTVDDTVARFEDGRQVRLDAIVAATVHHSL